MGESLPLPCNKIVSRIYLWISQKNPCACMGNGAARSKSSARSSARPRTACPWPTPPEIYPDATRAGAEAARTSGVARI